MGLSVLGISRARLFGQNLTILRGPSPSSRRVEGRAVRSLERVARIGVNESSGPSIYHIASYSETNEECNTDKGTRCTQPHHRYRDSNTATCNTPCQ